MYNVYLDDVRDAPDDTWTLVRDPAEFKDMIISGLVMDCSLDHDLGAYGETESGNEITGYDLLCWMEATRHLPKGRIFIHTGNPVGRMKMMVVVQRLNKV